MTDTDGELAVLREALQKAMRSLRLLPEGDPEADDAFNAGSEALSTSPRAAAVAEVLEAARRLDESMDNLNRSGLHDEASRCAYALHDALARLDGAIKEE